MSAPTPDAGQSQTQAAVPRRVRPAVIIGAIGVAVAVIAALVIVGVVRSHRPVISHTPASDLYVRVENQIFKIGTDGTLALFAGNGIQDAPVPGTALDSPMHPGGLALDAAGNLYIADLNGYVEKVTSDGVLSIVAGNGVQRAPVPGPALDSPMMPDDVVIDTAGNLYITMLFCVAKVTPDGMLSIIAGTPYQLGGAPVPGPALDSPLGALGAALDAADNLYLADAGYIVKITPEGVLSLVAGNGNLAAPVPGPALRSPLFPMHIAVDATGNTYTTAPGYVVKISPEGMLSLVAKNGDDVSTPAPGPVDHSTVSAACMAVDAAGNLYMGDARGYVVQVTPDGILSVVAGNGNTHDPPIPGPALDSPIQPLGLAA